MEPDDERRLGETIQTRIPPPVFAPGVVEGVYANQIQEISTDNETFLDFRYVVPSSYQLNDTGMLENIEVQNTVVARIILPRQLLATFLMNGMRSNPHLVDAIVAEREEVK